MYHSELFLLQTEPFQKPVSLEQHPDYAEYIFHPMDLCTLEKVDQAKLSVLQVSRYFFGVDVEEYWRDLLLNHAKPNKHQHFV